MGLLLKVKLRVKLYMKQFVLLIGILICQNSFSQTGFIKVIGRSADDIFFDMEELPDGGIMFGGTLHGDFNLTRCNGNADTLWTKIVNPGIEVTGMCVLTDNRIALSGWGNNGNDDFAAVIITDTSGNMVDSKYIYPDDSWGIWGYKVMSMPDSGLILVAYEDGYTCSNVLWMFRMDKNLQNVWTNGVGVCDADGFVSDEVNSTSGLLQICRRAYFDIDSLGNEFHDIPKFKNLDMSNNYLLDSVLYTGKLITGVSGTADSSILAFGTNDTLGSIENYLMKINSDGSIAWERTFGTGYDDSPGWVVETADHGFAVLSTERMPGNYNAPTVNVVFWKLDANGQIQHHEIYGSTGSECAVKLLKLSDRSLMILGSTDGFGPKVNFVIRLDSLGYLNTSYTINASSSHYCAGDTAILTVQPAGQNYLWSTGETTQSIQVTVNGNYEVTVIDSSGMNSAPFFAVWFDSIPDASLQSATQISICDGQTAELSVSYFQGYIYDWYRNGNLIDTVTLNAISIDTSGTYRLALTNACGTDISSSVSVTDHPLPLKPVIIGNPSLHECSQIYLTDSIMRNDTLHWAWSQHDVTADTLFLSQPSYYYLSVTAIDVNNCKSLAASVVASIDTQPNVQFATSTMNLCVPSYTAVPFTASANRATFTVIKDKIVSGTYSYVPGINATGDDTTIYLIMSNQCGSDTDTISFTAFPLPQINFIPPDPILCSGTSFELRSTAAGVYEWTYSGQTYSDSLITVDAPGWYSLHVTDPVSGCYSNKAVNVGTSINPSPSTGFLPVYILCPGDSVQLNAGNWSDYLWSNGSHDPSMAFGNVGHADTSIYTITIVDSSNCVNTDTVTIVSDLCMSVNQLEDQPKINVYPNPVSKDLHVEVPHFDSNDKIEIIIRNVPGEILYKEKVNSENFTIDVSLFPAGLYFISLESKNRKILNKFNVIK
jgi:hypothetical protein